MKAIEFDQTFDRELDNIFAVNHEQKSIIILYSDHFPKRSGTCYLVRHPLIWPRRAPGAAITVDFRYRYQQRWEDLTPSQRYL